MNHLALGPFLTGLAVTGGVVLAAFFFTWLVGLRLGRFNVVDTMWGLGFALVALTSLVWSRGEGHLGLRVLVTVLTCVWGLRLAAYIGWRSRGKGEDPRYEEMLDKGGSAPKERARYALVSVFGVQAAILWFVSLPVQVAMYERDVIAPLAVLGTALVAIGLFFEGVGDFQMSRFRADPANKGQVMDRGLWRYTRHPNYFGDACVWVGLYVIGAEHWVGALMVLSPAAMVWFLAFKTGAPLLERHMAETKPGYRDYMRRTSGFLPLPPRA